MRPWGGPSTQEGETHPRSGLHSRVWRPLPLPSWVTEARKVSRQPPHVMCSHKVTAHMLGAGCGDTTHQTREPISRRDRRGQCRLDGMLRAERGGCHTLCLSVHWGRGEPSPILSSVVPAWGGEAAVASSDALSGEGALAGSSFGARVSVTPWSSAEASIPSVWARSLVVPSASWTPNGWSRFKGGSRWPRL